MTPRYTPEALADIESLHAYIARQQSPRQAYRVALAIRQAIERLAMFPESGRIGRVAGTRELVVSRFPYLVIYILRDDNEAIVQRVLHTSQQWPPLPQTRP